MLKGKHEGSLRSPCGGLQIEFRSPGSKSQGFCSLLVSTDFPNAGLPVSGEATGASRSARAGMCQLLLKGAILALSPVQGTGRAALFPAAQSICAELHMIPKSGEAFLGLGMGFKTMQGSVLLQSPVSWAWENAGGRAPCSAAGDGFCCISCSGTEGPCHHGTLLKGGMCYIAFL